MRTWSTVYQEANESMAQIITGLTGLQKLFLETVTEMEKMNDNIETANVLAVEALEHIEPLEKPETPAQD